MKEVMYFTPILSMISVAIVAVVQFLNGVDIVDVLIRAAILFFPMCIAMCLPAMWGIPGLIIGELMCWIGLGMLYSDASKAGEYWNYIELICPILAIPAVVIIWKSERDSTGGGGGYSGYSYCPYCGQYVGSSEHNCVASKAYYRYCPRCGQYLTGYQECKSCNTKYV
jgi:hypothetical protein